MGSTSDAYKCGVPLKLLLARHVRPRRAHLDDDRRAVGKRARLRRRLRSLGGKRETDLATAGQLDIALGEELRVDQRAMLYAQAAVDAEAGAERIKAVLGARDAAAARATSVSTMRVRQTSARPQAPSSWLRKPKSKLALWATSGLSPMKSSSSSQRSCEARLVGEEGVAEAVDHLRPRSASAGRD